MQILILVPHMQNPLGTAISTISSKLSTPRIVAIPIFTLLVVAMSKRQYSSFPQTSLALSSRSAFLKVVSKTGLKFGS